MVRDTLRTLKEMGIVNEGNEEEVNAALEEVSCESYNLGLQDGELMPIGVPCYTGYGTREDYQ